MRGGALAGIKVIELGQMVSAPYCAKVFADYGADVIKVEPPGSGDAARQSGPFPGDQAHPEKSGLFQFLNTNKRGITLDLTSPGDRDALLGLLARADILLENNSPSQMRDWGLDYATLSKVNPELVMISITPFGQTGPYSEWKGYDLNAFHLSAAGHRYCGHPGQAPLEPGTFAADFFGAVAAAAWGLAAVYRRGAGQHVDVSCAEVIAAVFVGGQNIGGYAQDGVFERRSGVGLRMGAPATIVPCKDGHVWMLALEAGQWKGLARVMGDPDWMHLDMFQDMFGRAQNSDAIYPLLQEWTIRRGKWEIMEQCQAQGCPVTAVFNVDEAAEHPHLREREYIVELEHPVLGRLRGLGAPFKLPKSPGGPRRSAPLLGQHNAEVLGSPLNESPDTLKRPRRDGVLQAPPASSALPLQGVRVANFGWVWAGPVVGQTLGFLGADVYKIESRSRIDLLRALPPFAGGVRDPSRSLSNHACWAGNRSITLNLKRPEARELALRLVAMCDVVVENFGPGVMKELDLGYEELCAVRPNVILFSMPAAGLYGPLKDIRTYGLSLASTTGLDSLTGYFGGPPVPMEQALCDPYNGIMGAFAILAALHHRDRTGQGQHIDYSQQEAVMQMVGPIFMDYVMNGRVAGPMGNRHPLGGAAPHGVFPCVGEDRWISIAITNQAEWRGLQSAMDHPVWARAPAFETPTGRLENLDELHANLAAWTSGFDDYELARRLQRHEVAAAPVLNVADLLADPHYRARGTFLEVQHPLGFQETIYGAYVKTSRSQVTVKPGPAMGQDNDFVFRELLEVPEERYRQLIEQKIIY
jgi:crotonobetainyl-CoA:carnitine CoA-transferase CaiB-like acyl-CoA transferase